MQEEILSQAQQLQNEVADFREEVRRENQVAGRYFKSLLAIVAVGALLAVGVVGISQGNAKILNLIEDVLDPKGEYQKRSKEANAQRQHILTCTILVANGVAPPDCDDVRNDLLERKALIP